MINGPFSIANCWFTAGYSPLWQLHSRNRARISSKPFESVLKPETFRGNVPIGAQNGIATGKWLVLLNGFLKASYVSLPKWIKLTMGRFGFLEQF